MLLTCNSSFHFFSHLWSTDEILCEGTEYSQPHIAQNRINHICTLINQTEVACTCFVVLCTSDALYRSYTLRSAILFSDMVKTRIMSRYHQHLEWRFGELGNGNKVRVKHSYIRIFGRGTYHSSILMCQLRYLCNALFICTMLYNNQK